MYTVCNKHRLRVAVATEIFDSREERFEVDAPELTWRQLLDLAGFRPAEHSLFFRVRNIGALDALRPEDGTGLRGDRLHRLVVFESDPSFRVEINGRRLLGSAPGLSGLGAKRLAGETSRSTGIWLVRPDRTERSVRDAYITDLNRCGVDRLCTRPANALDVKTQELPVARSIHHPGADRSVGTLERSQMRSRDRQDYDKGAHTRARRSRRSRASALETASGQRRGPLVLRRTATRHGQLVWRT